MALHTDPFDAAEHLRTEGDVALYLEAAMEDGDPMVIQTALGTVARARGMTRIAEDAEMSRESLYKALSASGHPEFRTILRVLKALGFRLSVQEVVR